jgi:hypothetical protein
MIWCYGPHYFSEEKISVRNKKKIKNKPTFKCNKKIVGNINYDFHKGERKEF